MTTADTSVRLAWEADAAGIAAVLLSSWYGERLAERLAADGMTAADLAEAERRSLLRPPQARCRTLVALAGDTVVGVGRTGPATDPDADPATDGEVVELLVHPDATGAGHGSRLLQACADTLRADGFRRATHWVRTDDDALRAFLGSAGWAPDGAARELEDADGVPLRQVRLHTDLG